MKPRIHSGNCGHSHWENSPRTNKLEISGFKEVETNSVLKILNDLNFLYCDLNKLVAEYESVPWLGITVQEVKIGTESWTTTEDQKYFYIHAYDGNYWISRYTLDSLELVDKFSVSYYGGMDISDNELYVSDRNVLKVFNINTNTIIRQWNTPGGSNAIKLHNENLYYTTYNIIYIYTLTGTLIKQFGRKGNNNGEFMGPSGIDLDHKFIYITDCYNHRVQVFHLEKCNYSHQWGSYGYENGKFISPTTIRLYEGVCYIGELTSIQVFTKDGEFIKRFTPGKGYSGFKGVRGILMTNNRIFVSDSLNGRLVVLK